MRRSIFKTIKTIGAVVGLVTILSLSSLSAVAQDKGSMRVAFGDVPGGEMVNFMIAVARAAERGVKVEVSYLQSEDLAAQAIVSGQADIGVGTPYALIQKVNAPIRMFYQLAMLRFYPVVNGEKYQTWKDLDGSAVYRHIRTIEIFPGFVFFTIHYGIETQHRQLIKHADRCIDLLD